MFFPGSIPCMKSVDSPPTLNTTLSGHCLWRASRGAAALAKYATVSSSLLSHSRGESHTSSPSSSAAVAAVTSRPMSLALMLTALQCRSFLMISSSRCTTFGSKTGRQLKPITAPTS